MLLCCLFSPAAAVCEQHRDLRPIRTGKLSYESLNSNSCTSKLSYEGLNSIAGTVQTLTRQLVGEFGSQSLSVPYMNRCWPRDLRLARTVTDSDKRNAAGRRQAPAFRFALCWE